MKRAILLAAIGLLTAIPNARADRRFVVSNVPASIAGSGSWTSGCLAGGDFRAFDAFAALAGAATLQIQRYADPQCTYVLGTGVPATPLALASGGLCPATTFCGDIGLNDGVPFSGIKITITDTSTNTNAITVVYVTQSGP